MAVPFKIIGDDPPEKLACQHNRAGQCKPVELALAIFDNVASLL